MSLVDPEVLSRVNRVTTEALAFFKATKSTPGQFFSLTLAFTGKCVPRFKKTIVEFLESSKSTEVKRFVILDYVDADPPAGADGKENQAKSEEFNITLVAQIFARAQKERMTVRWIGACPHSSTDTATTEYGIAFPPLDATSFAKGQVPQTNIVESLLQKLLAATSPSRKDYADAKLAFTYQSIEEDKVPRLVLGRQGVSAAAGNDTGRGKRARSAEASEVRAHGTAAVSPTSGDAKITLATGASAPPTPAPAGATKKQQAVARQSWLRKAEAAQAVPQRPENAMMEDSGQRAVMELMARHMECLSRFHQNRDKEEAATAEAGVPLYNSYLEGDTFFSKLDSSTAPKIHELVPTKPADRHLGVHSPIQRALREKRYLPVLKVGEGTFGEVFLAKDLFHGRLVVIKQCRAPFMAETGIHNTIVRETQVATFLRYENLLGLVDYYVKPSDGGCCHMVFPLVSHDLPGVLRKWRSDMMNRKPQEYHQHQHAAPSGPDLLRRKNSRQPPSPTNPVPPAAVSGSLLAPDLAAVKNVFQQILQGLAELHESSIMHRDIKLSNILVRDDGTILLCDYGWSRLLGKDPSRNTWPPCTLFYRPPELLLGSKSYTQEVDIWSLGCLLIEIMCFQPLFPAQSELEAIGLISAALGPVPLDKKPYCDLQDIPLAVSRGNIGVEPSSSEKTNIRRSDSFSFLLTTKFGLGNIVDSTLIDFLLRMLCYDPTQRESARKLLGHPWLTGDSGNGFPGSRTRFVRPDTKKDLAAKLPKRNSYRFYDKADEMGGYKALWV